MFGTHTADSILSAPYVPAKLLRRSEVDFYVSCDADPNLDLFCRDADDLTEILLNNFNLAYFRPGEASDHEMNQDDSDGDNQLAAAPTAAETLPPAAAPAASPEAAPAAAPVPAPAPEPSDNPAPEPAPVHAPAPIPAAASAPAPEGAPRRAPIDVDETPAISEGQRVAMCFGSEGEVMNWYGGLVGTTNAQGARLVGFDDGDLQLFEEKILVEMMASGLAKPAALDEPVLVKNTTGVPKACAFSTVHEGGRGGLRTVGVLVGLEEGGSTIAGEALIQEHHVSASAFALAPVTRRRRDSSSSDVSQQERLGFHTFRRGDVVQYGAALEHESYFAVVHSLVYSLKKDVEQGCKMLVLFDEQQKTIFLGLRTEWVRVHTVARPYSVEDNSTAKTVDAAAYATMMQALQSAHI
eukprot:6207356-Pleurochrysis_carterae.AAC.1